MSREDEVRVRRRGKTRKVEAEPWRRAKRSLKPDGKSTVQVAQRAIASRDEFVVASAGANLRSHPQSSTAERLS